MVVGVGVGVVVVVLSALTVSLCKEITPFAHSAPVKDVEDILTNTVNSDGRKLLQLMFTRLSAHSGGRSGQKGTPASCYVY